MPITPGPTSALGFVPSDGDVIRFEPRFPLEPGMRYRAEFDPDRLHVALAVRRLIVELDYRPSEPRSTARLIAEYLRPGSRGRCDPRRGGLSFR